MSERKFKEAAKTGLFTAAILLGASACVGSGEEVQPRTAMTAEQSPDEYLKQQIADGVVSQCLGEMTLVDGGKIRSTPTNQSKTNNIIGQGGASATVLIKNPLRMVVAGSTAHISEAWYTTLVSAGDEGARLGFINETAVGAFVLNYDNVAESFPTNVVYIAPVESKE